MKSFKPTTIARVLILCLVSMLCFATADAVPAQRDKAPVIKQVPAIDMAAAMHETVIGIEGKLMPYEFYRRDTWSKKVTVPSQPRKRPEPAPV